jgi:predicted membrane protein
VKRGRVLVGVGLLAVGGVLLAGEADLLDAGDVISSWWPLGIVALGLLKFTSRPRDVGGAVAVTAVGLVLLAWSLDLIGIALLPIVLIAAGLVVLFRTPHAERAQVATSDLELVAIFGSRDARVTTPVFLGGEAVAIFGGIDLDLRSTALPREGATLELVSIFGDIDLLLPMGWAVEVSGPAVFGDLDDRTLGAPAGAPVLRIRSTVVFGDVELRTDAMTHAHPTT